jgi:hypothetical protein
MLQAYKNITGFLGSMTTKHPLLKIAPFHPDFLKYFDHLISEALTVLDALNATEEQRRVLREKLLDGNGFFAAVTEVETLIHLHHRGFEIRIEPLYPSRGPDFFVEKDDFQSFVEDRSIGPEDHEIGLDLKFEYLRTKLDKVKSRYSLHFTIPDGFVAYSKELKRAVSRAIDMLRKVEKENRKEAALYYLGPDDYVLLDKNILLAGYDANASEQELEIQSRCMQPGIFVVDYQQTSPEPISGMYALGDEPRWLRPHSRILKSLHAKISQMQKGARNVIALDISHANVTETNVTDALYGSIGIEIRIDPATGRPAMAGQIRERDGFFRLTTRVQAVVSVRRSRTAEAGFTTIWTVFPTNNDKAELPMTREELSQFGTVVEAE